MSSATELVTLSALEGGVRVIRLERAEARNALNSEMLVSMLELLDVVASDEEARALVISSNDHLGLSAGADVREELDEAGRVKRMELFADLYDTVVTFPSPLSLHVMARWSGAVRKSQSDAISGSREEICG